MLLARVGAAEVLAYAGLGWGDAEAKVLAAALSAAAGSARAGRKGADSAEGGAAAEADAGAAYLLPGRCLCSRPRAGRSRAR